MPQVQHARHISTKSAIALLLTFAAGCVDIVGYLAIYQIFTANMTGATVHLSRNVMQAHWPGAVPAACVLAAFMGGSVIGRIVIEIGSRTRVRSIASATLLLEVALIALVIPTAARSPKTPVLGLLAMLAAAMGLQTATLTRVGSLTVHTTFVTGMLNKLAQLISEGMFLSYDLRRGRDVMAVRQRTVRRAQFMFAIWVLYLIGAAAGTWMRSIWGLRSLLLPAGLVTVAIIADQIVPLAIEEEHEEP
jgi:uncharacterized membrane protein YoaK (UPF0700 family)